MRCEELTGPPPRSDTNLADDLARRSIKDLDDVVAQVRVVHIGLLRVRGERQVGRPLWRLKSAFRTDGNGALEDARPVELENPAVRTIAGIQETVFAERDT